MGLLRPGFSIIIRDAPDVLAQPRVLLKDWRVFDDGEVRFLAGLLANGTTMRFTTAIQSIDATSRTWVTSSGRVYLTPDPPAADAALRFVLENTAKVFSGKECLQDCTEVWWSRLRLGS